MRLRRLAILPRRIEAHSPRAPDHYRFLTSLGVELRHRWTAIAASPLCPGGDRGLSVLRPVNAVRQGCRVPRIVMVVSRRRHVKLSPWLLAAANSPQRQVYALGGPGRGGACLWDADDRAGRQSSGLSIHVAARQRLVIRKVAST